MCYARFNSISSYVSHFLNENSKLILETSVIRVYFVIILVGAAGFLQIWFKCHVLLIYQIIYK